MRILNLSINSVEFDFKADINQYFKENYLCQLTSENNGQWQNLLYNSSLCHPLLLKSKK